MSIFVNILYTIFFIISMFTIFLFAYIMYKRTRNCKAGSFKDQNQTCKECSPGYFNEISSKRQYCKICPAGTYQDSPGMTGCISCPKGTVQEIGGQSQCNQCNEGIPSETQTNCIKCPDNDGLKVPNVDETKCNFWGFCNDESKGSTPNKDFRSCLPSTLKDAGNGVDQMCQTSTYPNTRFSRTNPFGSYAYQGRYCDDGVYKSVLDGYKIKQDGQIVTCTKDDTIYLSLDGNDLYDNCTDIFSGWGYSDARYSTSRNPLGEEDTENWDNWPGSSDMLTYDKKPIIVGEKNQSSISILRDYFIKNEIPIADLVTRIQPLDESGQQLNVYHDVMIVYNPSKDIWVFRNNNSEDFGKEPDNYLKDKEFKSLKEALYFMIEYCPKGCSNIPSGGCKLCEEATYKDNELRQICSNCPDNTYQNQRGQTSCIDCPQGGTIRNGTNLQLIYDDSDGFSKTYTYNVIKNDNVYLNDLNNFITDGGGSDKGLNFYINDSGKLVLEIIPREDDDDISGNDNIRRYINLRFINNTYTAKEFNNNQVVFESNPFPKNVCEL